MWGAIASLIVSLFQWIFGKKEEDSNVTLGRTEAQKDAAEAELVRVDKAMDARDGVLDDFDSLRDSPDNRANPPKSKR